MTFRTPLLLLLLLLTGGEKKGSRFSCGERRLPANRHMARLAAFVLTRLCSCVVVFSRQNNPNLRRMKHKDVRPTHDLQERILKCLSFLVRIHMSGQIAIFILVFST